MDDEAEPSLCQANGQFASLLQREMHGSALFQETHAGQALHLPPEKLSSAHRPAGAVNPNHAWGMHSTTNQRPQTRACELLQASVPVCSSSGRPPGIIISSRGLAQMAGMVGKGGEGQAEAGMATAIQKN